METERHYLVSSLEFRKKLKNVSDSEYRRLRDNYDDFIEQPLKLEMFAPCDEGGNVFEKPSDEELEKFKGLEYGSFDCNYTYIFDYNLAKEKVLFEHKLQFDLGVIRHHISQGRNIEYFANFGSMQLTKTALNAIFG